MTLSLLKRFPKLRAPTESWPVIPESKRDGYPDLAADFAIIDREVAPAFTEYDTLALRLQNSYRRQQVLIILGSALVTGLGGLQAVFSHQRWPGLVLAVLGILLAATTKFANEQALLPDYLSARVKAERLRGLHFRYLAATGRYARADRLDVLRRDVLAIQRGEDPE